MNYKKFINGESIIGKVKCTYTTLYNEKGDGFFSLQKKNFSAYGFKSVKMKVDDGFLVQVDLTNELFDYLKNKLKKDPTPLFGNIFVKPEAVDWKRSLIKYLAVGLILWGILKNEKK